MNAERLEHYREQLLALSRRVERTAAGLEEQTRTVTGGEAGGGLSNAPLHMGDMGSEVYNQELSATLLENETYIRDEAHAALERVERGTFGRCEACAQPIPAARLEALPYARHCVPCATALQSGRAVNLNDGRPDGWLGAPGHEGTEQAGSPARVVGRNVGSGPGDAHAAGTPGGGSEVGGLAGTNVGAGGTEGVKLEKAMATGRFDASAETAVDGEDEPQAFAGPSGGAVGGTPANKRSRGGRSAKADQTAKAPKAEPAKKTRAKKTKE